MKSSAVMASILLMTLAGCTTGTDVFASRPSVNAANWKSVATEDDRTRLRGWRGAFVKGLEQAKSTNAQDVLAMGPVLWPDLATLNPLPPVGDYRCRIIKLGNSTYDPRPVFIAYPWYPCGIADRGNGTWRFAMLDGAQRPIGTIYSDQLTRGVFLGTLQLSDETHKMPYDRDLYRDMAGFVERVDDARWRIILPRPHFESVMDVIEIAPN